MFAEQNILIIPEERRHTRDYGWLRTSWLFSFNDYHDPSNLGMGPLRAFNDDLVQPGKGYADHRHGEMEIVTFVLDGELCYRDSAGREGAVRRDEVLRMSAGTGVIHSEYNLAAGPAHHYQMWFRPRESGLPPSYVQGAFLRPHRQDRLQVLASGEGRGGLEMSADATVGACELSADSSIEAGGEGRMMLIYLSDGTAVVEGREVGRNGQVRFSGRTEISTERGAKLVVVDMPEDR